ncbi:Hippocampus abundant transcript 1 protein [Holothuria leucospilota]|uniref:Hippocampus abundant transcript 1 protein n=1 Tax=Holothuria leucospilota TaxID=206669 RepID=A0A9Q1C983_HOLLE|nr:Hippocampus abundant transcript 1 protein [Holothuria leucospilota]
MKKRKKIPRKKAKESIELTGIGDPSIYHALIVIFLEFFAWGLLTNPMLTVLNETFPKHTFLMNGLVQGVKGTLSFLSAPLVGALSDVWGRKSFLLLTVFFTCMPIPLMKITPWWFFAMISVSGVFSVTFSIIFAYVADITDESERSSAYGLVSATFAASLIISPALGTYLGSIYGDSFVIFLATAVALCDILFVLVAVPESLSEKLRPASWGAAISWEQADPFMVLRKVGQDYTVLMLCVAVFLSYLPEAGQYSCMFLYLKMVGNFSEPEVPAYIAFVGILSVFAQTTILGILTQNFGHKHTIMVGLTCEMLEQMWYGLGSELWMLWSAGVLVAISSINYPAISALVSRNAPPDKQGVLQGMITGIRSLCNGLGPALYGFIFYFFDMDLDQYNKDEPPAKVDPGSSLQVFNLPGPPFVFGSVLVLLSQLVMFFLPRDDEHDSTKPMSPRSFQMQPVSPGPDLVVPLLEDSNKPVHSEDFNNP